MNVRQTVWFFFALLAIALGLGAVMVAVRLSTQPALAGEHPGDMVSRMRADYSVDPCGLPRFAPLHPEIIDDILSDAQGEGVAVGTPPAGMLLTIQAVVATPTPLPSNTPTPMPTPTIPNTPTRTPRPTFTRTSTPVPTSTPTRPYFTPTPTPVLSPTIGPTFTPQPGVTPPPGDDEDKEPPPPVEPPTSPLALPPPPAK